MLKKIFLSTVLLCTCVLRANVLDTVELNQMINGNTEDKKVTLRSLIDKEKGLLIDFWAYWCGPCRAAMPELIQTAEELKGKVRVVAVNIEGNRDGAEKGLKAFKPTFPWLYENNGALSQHFGIRTIPCWVILNLKGEVVYKGHPANKTQWQAAIEKL